MTPEQLLQTLQFSDTLFPTGGFAYSGGLETAVVNGTVSSVDDLRKWLLHFVQNVFPQFDGLAVRFALEAHERNDWQALRSLDEECTALRPSAEARAASTSQGRGFLKSTLAMHPDGGLERLSNEIAQNKMDGNFAVVYGIVAADLELTLKDALPAFAYARLAGMVSAALRLMSIGQLAAQRELSKALESVPLAVERVLHSRESWLTSFTPLLDIQQMNHRYVYSRLFRS